MFFRITEKIDVTDNSVKDEGFCSVASASGQIFVKSCSLESIDKACDRLAVRSSPAGDFPETEFFYPFFNYFPGGILRYYLQGTLCK